LRCWVVTVSDSRTRETDDSGKLIAEKLGGAGHVVAEHCVVPDVSDALRDALLRAIARPDVDVALVTGGTGVSARDGTPELVEPLLERKLEGFGELFRMLSFQEIGPAAMLSRALAGSAGRTAVFVMPGSQAAVRLAMERLILPELAHLVGQLRRS
jgi:molybdenum cofactor biosynthesis protein B